MGLYNPSTLTSTPITSSTSNVTSANAQTSASSFPANANRKGLSIANISNANMFIMFPTSNGNSVGLSSYSVKLESGGYYEVPFGFTGAINYLWDFAEGVAIFTEFS